MTNVYGPFDSSEWETLLCLKKAIQYETSNPSVSNMLERDSRDYLNLINKAA